MHSAAAQARGSRAVGLHVRRQEIETIHPGMTWTRFRWLYVAYWLFGSGAGTSRHGLEERIRQPRSAQHDAMIHSPDIN